MANEELGKNITFPIYNSDGTPFHDLVMHKATYDSVVMSLGDKITGDVYYKDNSLAVTMQEYIEYKPNDDDDVVRFVLVNPPTIVREGLASDNGELKGMTKYSFVFYHPMCMLSNIPFTDIAVTNNEKRYLSQNKTFSWIGNCHDFVAKINKNLESTQWVVIESQETHSQAKMDELSDVLAFDNVFISDALKKAYDTWEIPFVIHALREGEYFDDDDTDYYSLGKRFVILFGLPSTEILDEYNQPFVFRMGQGVGLKNNSRTPRNNKIITRIAGYGSEDNIPYGYPQIVWTGNQDWDYTINNDSSDPNSYPLYMGIVGGQNVKLIKHPFTRNHLMPTVYVESVNNKVNPYSPDYDPDTEIVDYVDATEQFPNPIVQDAPSFEIHQFDKIKPELGDASILDAYAYAEQVVGSSTASMNDGGFITFSAFHTMIADLYSSQNIYYPALDSLVAFDVAVIGRQSASDEKTGGAYNYEWSVVVQSDGIVRAKYVSDRYNINKKIVEASGQGQGERIDWIDDIDEEGNYVQSYFKIKLPTLSFDLYASAAITQQMQINMRSGACMGCTFPVQVDWEDYRKNMYDANGNFAPYGQQRDYNKYPDSRNASITVIVQKDTDTFGTLMPNVYQNPRQGDKFVILGISLPLSYIEDAQERLDEAMTEYMLENNFHYYDYPLKFDEYFLAKNVDILAQIRNNNIVRFMFGGEENVLYIKQITIQYGSSTLPQYSITLTDDVEIVLNQIGQVTDDVSRMRVQVNELQKYYSKNVEELINAKLSRVSDDIALGRITFQEGLNAMAKAIFSDELSSPDFVSGLYTGRGWHIDNRGNAEFESVRVRSFLEIVELLVNRLQAQEGDTIFTDNDQIDKVEKVTDETTHEVSYILTLKEKYEGYVTGQMYGNIIKGIINTLAAKQAGVSDETSGSVERDGANYFYTSWMRVVETSTMQDSILDTNQIRVVLYGDNDVPANKNFEPCELMTIARWGCVDYADEDDEQELASIERRQRMFYISVTDGRIVKLRGVNKPILESWNYGTTIGTLPEFMYEWQEVAEKALPNRDYLYAQGIVVQNIIEVYPNGQPKGKYVDCGEWRNNTQYLVYEYNNLTGDWETHDVWHNGCKWRCLQHQPVVSNGVSTYYEPQIGSSYWMLMEWSGSLSFMPSIILVNTDNDGVTLSDLTIEIQAVAMIGGMRVYPEDMEVKSKPQEWEVVEYNHDTVTLWLDEGLRESSFVGDIVIEAEVRNIKLTGSLTVAAVKQGADGQTGGDIIYADLSNEMDAVPLNNDGTVALQTSLSTVVKMYAGNTESSIKNISTAWNDSSSTGRTVTIVRSGAYPTGEINITIGTNASFVGDRLVLHIAATDMNDNIKNLDFVIVGVRSGVDGDMATIYQLKPSNTAIKVAKNGFRTPESIECGIVKRIGNNPPTDVWDGSCTIQYEIDEDDPENYTHGDTIDTSLINKNIRFLLYQGETLIDIETVPVVADGTDGDGENSVRLDLDNEMDSMIYQSTGEKVTEYVETRARLYDGNEIVPPSQVAWSYDTNNTCVASRTTTTSEYTTFRVSQLYGVESASLTITATYKNTSYVAVFIVKKLINETKYELELSHDSVGFDPNTDTLSPYQIDIKIYETKMVDGALVRSLRRYLDTTDSLVISITKTKLESTDEDYHIDIDGHSDLYQDGYTFNELSSDAQNYVVEIFDDHHEKLYDRETIPIVRNGINGADGESPLIFDIDNEMDTIPLDSSGDSIEDWSIVLHASMFYGTHQQALTSLTCAWEDDTDIQTIANTQGGTITINVESGDSLTNDRSVLIITGVCEQGTRTASFTLAGVRGGADGKSAVIYKLSPSDSSIKVTKDGTYYPTTIGCDELRVAGGGTPSIVHSHTIKYSIDNGVETLFENAINTNTISQNIRFFLYNGATLIDKETIPVIFDGEDGEKGEDGKDGKPAPSYRRQQYSWSSFATTRNNTTAPTDATWYDYIPSNNDSSKPHLWLKDTLFTWNEYAITSSGLGAYVSTTTTYTRITGEDGTGVAIKGSFTDADIIAAGYSTNNIRGYLSHEHPSPQVGDGYMYQTNGHLWLWNGTTWQDVGQIKGDNGASSYIHLAWAHAVGENGYPEDGMGFVVAKRPQDSYEYMGIYADNDVNDSQTPSDYEWTRVKGEGNITLDLDNEMDSMLYDNAGNLISGSVTSRARLYNDGVQIQSGITFEIYSTSGLTTYQCTMSQDGLLTVNGMNANSGWVLARAQYNGNWYYAKLTLKRLIDVDKYEVIVTPNSIAYNITNNTPSTTDIEIEVFKISSSQGRQKLSSLPFGFSLRVVGINSSFVETEIPTSSSPIGWSFIGQNSSYKEYRVDLLQSSTIVDTETIPIVKATNGAGGEFYYIESSQESYSIPSDTESITTTLNVWLKHNVGGVVTDGSAYWVVYKRRGNQYTFAGMAATSRVASYANSNFIVQRSDEAVVVYAVDSKDGLPLHRPTTYLAKKELAVIGQGNTGENGGQGEKGDKGDSTIMYSIQVVSSDIAINASSRLNGKVEWKVLKHEGSEISSVAKEYGYHEYRLNNSQTWLEADADETDVVMATDEYSDEQMSGVFPTFVEIRFGKEFVNGELQVLASTTVSITTQGQMGRNFYYAGEYDSATSYTLTNFEAPFVSLTENGQTTYWVRFGDNGTITGQKPSSSSKYWRLMSSNFTYLITQAVFSNFAKLGSAIFNLDYMFSQQGVIKGYGGVTTQVATGDTQYQYADVYDMEGVDMDGVPLAGKSDYTGDSTNPNPYVTGLIQSRNTLQTVRLRLEANRYYTIEFDFQANDGIVLHGALTKADAQYTEVGYAEITTTDNNPTYDRLCFNARTDESGDYCVRITNLSYSASDVVWMRSYRVRACKFAPSLYINLKTGEMFANDLTARGMLYASSVGYSKIVGTGNNEVLYVGDASFVALKTTFRNANGIAKVVLPDPSTCQGRVIELYRQDETNTTRGQWQLNWENNTSAESFYDAFDESSLSVNYSYSGIYYIKFMATKNPEGRKVWCILNKN